jgi:hypothetical protein
MPEPQTGHMPYFALTDALNAEGCALCTLVLRSLERYFDGLVYEKINRSGIRDQVRSSQGFCAAHGEMLRQARSALGTAIIHRDVLRSLSRHLEKAQRSSGSPGNWLRGLVQSGEPKQLPVLDGATTCPGCVHASEAEKTYIDTLLANWPKEELQSAFRAAPGLCVPHLRSTLDLATEPAIFEAIRSIQLEKWRALVSELEEFIRKQDYRFSHEPLGSERDSAYRSIRQVSGLWQVEGSRTR